MLYEVITLVNPFEVLDCRQVCAGGVDLAPIGMRKPLHVHFCLILPYDPCRRVHLEQLDMRGVVRRFVFVPVEMEPCSLIL